MHDWAQKLLILQDKDLRIGKIEEQVNAAPAEKAKALKGKEEAETAVAEAKKRLQGEQSKLRELENEGESLRQKMRDFQSKSAMIKNNEEYRAATTQIQSCAQEINKLEDRELGIMEQIEAHRVALHEQQKLLAAADARAKEMLADLDTRVSNCSAQLEKLRAERNQALTEVDPQIIQKYERIRTGNLKRNLSDRRILVALKAGACDRCHLNVTAQVRMNVRKGQPVSCENCGAMLHWEE